MKAAEMNTSDVNQTTNLNLERRSTIATRAARGIKAGIAIMCVALSLAVEMGNPASASSPDASARWSIVPSPNEVGANWLVAVDASASNDAWAVGYYIGDEGLYETLSMHWDGLAWTLVEPLNVGEGTGDWLYGVAAVSPSEAWAVGSTAGPWDTYTSTTLIEHWTGSAWSVVPSPNPSDDPISTKAGRSKRLSHRTPPRGGDLRLCAYNAGRAPIAPHIRLDRAAR